MYSAERQNALQPPQMFRHRCFRACVSSIAGAAGFSFGNDDPPPLPHHLPPLPDESGGVTKIPPFAILIEHMQHARDVTA